MEVMVFWVITKSNFLLNFSIASDEKYSSTQNVALSSDGSVYSVKVLTVHPALFSLQSLVF